MRRRLAFRLVLALTLTIGVVEGVFAYINIRTQESQLLGEMILGADQLSRSLTSATWHSMALDRREAAYEIMQTISHKQGIKSVRIFNKEGRVTFSTDPRAAKQVDKNAEACFLCHAREQPLVRVDVPSRARIFRVAAGPDMLGMVTPIYNEQACSEASCHAHPASKSVLGVLDVTMDLEHVHNKVAATMWRSVLMTLTGFVLVALCIVIIIRRMVESPIQSLADGVKAVSRMELDEPVTVAHAPVEIEELAASFNAMRERLKTALAELNAFASDLERKIDERTRQLTLTQQQLLHSERLASLGQLAASVAHEINNPLSGVLNLSMLMQRLLTDKGVPPGRIDEFRRYLKLASDETARVGRTVADLLAFSRRSTPVARDTDLNVVVTTTVSLVRHKLELARVTPEMELAPSLPLLSCDRSQMQQVVLNLVMNAAEAMPRGGTVRVTTAHDAATKRLVLTVADQGVGIPEANLPRIFDPFFTTKDEGKGVGLGLAVVYGIVQAHRGTIDVKSAVGAGTTFSVRLPIAEAEGRDASTAAGG